MKQSNSEAAILSIALDRQDASPLHLQLSQALRLLILDERLTPGDRLPSSRSLAAELSVSRATVVTAIEQLVSEGYVLGRRGAGAFVAEDLPDRSARGAASSARMRARTPPATALETPAPPRPFEVTMPDLERFPHKLWAKALEQSWRSPAPALLANPDPLGWAPLRVAIARHLSEWRGVDCAPSQIAVTSGAAEAVDLIAAAALSPGDEVLVEEPGYDRLRRALARNGLRWRPVEVDEKGFDIALGQAQAHNPRAAFVAPSRQYPLGVTLPLGRRLDLLAWAAQSGGYVVEDDYDGEYRFQGRPPPALMSLDRHQRVIYLGSFSRVMFPALRLGFLALPEPLAEACGEALARQGPRAALTAQPALARFMESGDFARHIRRMRRLYGERRNVLRDLLERRLGRLLKVSAPPAGMHLIAYPRPRLQERLSDEDVAERAAEAGLSVRPLSRFYAGRATRQGLVLGYAAFTPSRLTEAVESLRRALEADAPRGSDPSGPRDDTNGNKV